MIKNVPLRISLIEDNERLRQLVARWLQPEADFTVVSQYADAETACQFLANDHPDVVLVDINLPGQNGIDCVRQLKPKLPATQFAMMTVYEDASRIFNALAAGASGYLLKQTQRTELIGAIRELHRGGSPMSTNIARKVVQFFQQPATAKFATAAPESKLSEREQQVLDGLVKGALYKEIADELGISMGTIHTYIRRIYEKLHVHSRAQAVAKVSLGETHFRAGLAGEGLKRI